MGYPIRIWLATKSNENGGTSQAESEPTFKIIPFIVVPDLCSLVELSEEVVERLDELADTEGGRERGEVADVGEKDAHCLFGMVAIREAKQPPIINPQNQSFVCRQKIIPIICQFFRFWHLKLRKEPPRWIFGVMFVFNNLGKLGRIFGQYNCRWSDSISSGNADALDRMPR